MGSAASIVKQNRNIYKAGSLLPVVKNQCTWSQGNIEKEEKDSSEKKSLMTSQDGKNASALSAKPVLTSGIPIIFILFTKFGCIYLPTRLQIGSFRTPPSTNWASDFRKRRLSVATKRTSWRAAPAPPKLPSSLFQSQEIGAYFDVSLPFSEFIVGSYSCHGIEPSYYANDGIAAKINQDRGCIIYPLGTSRKEVILSVFDGHGEHGEVVSHFAMSNLCSEIEVNQHLQSDPQKALRTCILNINESLRMNFPAESVYSGTTCVCVYINTDRMFIANVGDSRAVLAKKSRAGEYSAHSLTNDQNPDTPSEMERIKAAGGFVSPPPEPGLSSRVWLDPEMTLVGLAMARSIGDFAVKPVGVIADPEITEHRFSAEDSFLIIASDGVWEFMSNEEAVETVAKHLSHGYMRATQALIEAAAERWNEIEGDYRDDITAIVLRIPCFSEEDS